MSIQKKSLISTLKTAKKANVAGANTHEVDAKGAKVASMRVMHNKAVTTKQVAFSSKKMLKTSVPTMRAVTAKSFKSTKSFK
jgi:hypothetical protein